MITYETRLRISKMLVEMGECSNKDKILKQAIGMDWIITQLDRVWPESAKIRTFLKKYHDIGDKEK